jgi:ferritin-like metal-binding protein YciE
MRWCSTGWSLGQHQITQQPDRVMSLMLSQSSQQGERIMAAQTAKEVFVHLLSNVRQGTEQTTKIWQEMSPMAQDPDIKEALEARVFISGHLLARLDQCFKLLGEQPVKLSGRLHDVFVEDFRKELADIQSPAARHLFILAKALHLVHLRMAEYVALIAAADVSGHYGVGVLLESCLADKLAFVERTRRLIRHIVETKVAERVHA